MNKKTITNVLLTVSLVLQLILTISVNKEVIALNNISENNDTDNIVEEVFNKEDDTKYGMVTFARKSRDEMVRDTQSFISSGKYSDYCRYGESLEIIDVEYEHYYMTILDSDEVLIWESTVVFKYQDGDVDYGLQK